MLVGVKVQEQLLDLVHDLVGTGVGTVNLVDHQDDRETGFERLAEHEARLRERALGRIDHEQHAVDHRERPFDLPAEVGVARRVDDVDLDPAVSDRGVLGEDRDPLLALEIHRVHHALRNVLVGPERTRLPEHRVDQRGLTVIDVGDDRDVADVLAGRHGEQCRDDRGPPHGLRPRPARCTNRPGSSRTDRQGGAA